MWPRLLISGFWPGPLFLSSTSLVDIINIMNIESRTLQRMRVIKKKYIPRIFPKLREWFFVSHHPGSGREGLKYPSSDCHFYCKNTWCKLSSRDCHAFTHVRPMLDLCRNQLIYLLCKSVDWFLYECNTGLIWVENRLKASDWFQI